MNDDRTAFRDVIWTGIGSLPHADLAAAVDHVRRAYALWPFVPDVGGNGNAPLLLRAAYPPALADFLRPRGTDVTLTADDSRLVAAFEPHEGALMSTPYVANLAAALSRFGALDPATPLKLQLVGPCTMLAAMRDALSQPLWHEPALRAAASRWIGALAEAAIGMAQRHAPEIALWLDEPMLGHLDSDAAAAIACLAPLAAGVRRRRAAAGLHTCSRPTFPILGALDLDHLSLDLVRYEDEIVAAAAPLSAMIEHGTTLVLGVVAVLPVEDDRPPHRALARLHSSLSPAAAARLRERLVLSPACGTLLAPLERELDIAALLAAWARALTSADRGRA